LHLRAHAGRFPLTIGRADARPPERTDMNQRRDSQTDAGSPRGAEIPRGTDEQATDTTAADSPQADGGSPVSGGEQSDAGTDRQDGEQREKYLRLAAEYDNFRKRASRERQEAGQRAQADLVKQLIDALDDLARFAHVDPATVDASTVVQGADMVEKKLHKALLAAGLQIINPVDQPFDPSQHEAVMTEPALSPEDDHMVGRVFQPGYLFGSQLLRPARVVVKQWNG
jgi:molecular chaperone GrpE